MPAGSWSRRPQVPGPSAPATWCICGPTRTPMGCGAWANISRTMRLLVTGGAGFIGSNFARYWVEQHPEDHVVLYDVLTYAGNRPSLSDIEYMIVFVQGDICDPIAAEKALRGE